MATLHIGTRCGEVVVVIFWIELRFMGRHDVRISIRNNGKPETVVRETETVLCFELCWRSDVWRTGI